MESKGETKLITVPYLAFLHDVLSSACCRGKVLKLRVESWTLYNYFTLAVFQNVKPSIDVTLVYVVGYILKHILS